VVVFSLRGGTTCLFSLSVLWVPGLRPPGDGGPLRAIYGSASQPAMIIGKDSGRADAVLAPIKISKTTPCKVAWCR
jgi:hypothetical protein